MIGLEVEHIDDKAKALAPFVIARVVEAKQHPNADRLRVCMVDTGSGDPVQVVCGAPNARSGMKGVFVPPGAFIPGKNMTLAVGTIRGVESRGMLVSGFELQISDDHDGIIELPDDAPVGQSYAAWAHLDDRGDRHQRHAQSSRLHRRARHRARSRGGRHGPLQGEHRQAGEGRVCLARSRCGSTSATTPSLCPAFGLRLVRGVKNGPSPAWLQRRLTRDRAAPHQRAGRHHQLHHLRPRPAAARVRRRQGEGQSRGPPRPRRRDAARARRQDLHARRHHVRDRRRQRRRVARRHHGRRGDRLSRTKPPTC